MRIIGHKDPEWWLEHYQKQVQGTEAVNRLGRRRL
jgi:hypothetical protein